LLVAEGSDAEPAGRKVPHNVEDRDYAVHDHCKQPPLLPLVALRERKRQR
jgi:hypothetical protein